MYNFPYCNHGNNTTLNDNLDVHLSLRQNIALLKDITNNIDLQSINNTLKKLISNSELYEIAIDRNLKIHNGLLKQNDNISPHDIDQHQSFLYDLQNEFKNYNENIRKTISRIDKEKNLENNNKDQIENELRQINNRANDQYQEILNIRQKYLIQYPPKELGKKFPVLIGRDHGSDNKAGTIEDILKKYNMSRQDKDCRHIVLYPNTILEETWTNDLNIAFMRGGIEGGRIFKIATDIKGINSDRYYGDEEYEQNIIDLKRVGFIKNGNCYELLALSQCKYIFSIDIDDGKVIALPPSQNEKLTNKEIKKIITDLFKIYKKYHTFSSSPINKEDNDYCTVNNLLDIMYHNMISINKTRQTDAPEKFIEKISRDNFRKTTNKCLALSKKGELFNKQLTLSKKGELFKTTLK